MTAKVSPVRARLYPEVLPEAITVTAESDGTNIASYLSFSPFMIVMNRLYTEQAIDVVTRVDHDSSYATLNSENECRSDREESDIEIPCTTSMSLWASGASVVAKTAFTMKIMKPTIFEKIKYGLYLSNEEATLAAQFDIQKRFKAGLLKQIDTPIFQQVIEVVKKVTVAGGSNTRVGSLINVGSGKKAAIISIGTDSAFAGLAANDTYITINRDTSDDTYVKLDTFAMPGLNHNINCYIPGVDRLEVILEAATTRTDMPVRFKYGISDLTILEKIKWKDSIDGGLTAEESAIAIEFDLFNAVVAGVM